MKKLTVGFTLSEVLISVGIIGVIMALSVNSIKVIKASYTSLAYFAHKNLVQNVGYMMSNTTQNVVDATSSGTNLSYATGYCYDDNGSYYSVLRSDNESNDTPSMNCYERSESTSAKTNIFCKNLAALSNTKGYVDCANLHVASKSINRKPYITINPDSPNFVTTNGQRYYISNWSYWTDVSSIYGYRLVAVDLNGATKPNIMSVENNTPPDIITFLVLDNGEVFPLGVAADNATLSSGTKVNYISSRIKGYYYSDDPTRLNYDPGCGYEDKLQPDGQKRRVPRTCNYGIVTIEETDGDDTNDVFTYRRAYCSSLGGGTSAYARYCSNVELPAEGLITNASTLCPPSTNSNKFDLCRVTNIKPMFRYNFK